jgi:hypothetical protein
MSISNTLLRVTLPSTNEAVYEVQPQHLNDQPGTTLAERARMLGRQVAVRLSGEWYERLGPGRLRKITDPKTWAALQKIPEA